METLKPPLPELELSLFDNGDSDDEPSEEGFLGHSRMTKECRHRSATIKLAGTPLTLEDLVFGII